MLFSINRLDRVARDWVVTASYRSPIPARGYDPPGYPSVFWSFFFAGVIRAVGVNVSPGFPAACIPDPFKSRIFVILWYGTYKTGELNPSTGFTRRRCVISRHRKIVLRTALRAPHLATRDRLNALVQYQSGRRRRRTQIYRGWRFSVPEFIISLYVLPYPGDSERGFVKNRLCGEKKKK